MALDASRSGTPARWILEGERRGSGYTLSSEGSASVWVGKEEIWDPKHDIVYVLPTTQVRYHSVPLSISKLIYLIGLYLDEHYLDP